MSAASPGILPSSTVSPPGEGRLHVFLAALGRRERGLLLARAALQGLGVVVGLGPMAVLLAVVRLPPDVARNLFLLSALAGLVAALALPLALRWRSTRDTLHQARLVEDLRKGLEGRLLVAAARPSGARPGESEALLRRIQDRAAREIGDLSPSHVYPLRSLWVLAAVDTVAVLVWATLAWWSPLGPVGALQRILGGIQTGIQAQAQAAPPVESPPALIGDIVLRYLYPAYTGLEPLLVPNSTGEVHGPPGTTVEIQARSGSVFQAASLVLRLSTPPSAGTTAGPGAPPPAAQGGEEILGPATLANGRDLATSFEIRAPGTWLFRLEGPSGVEQSPACPIVVEPDLPPEVLVEAPPGVLVVSWDQPIPVRWTTRDDYGIVRVEAVATLREKSTTRPLETALDRPVRLEGPLRATPADLGLAPDDAATLKVVAWDNDEISGSKSGESRVLSLLVLGPQGESARQRQVLRELRDLLVTVLAGDLEEDPPWASQPGLVRSLPSRGEASTWSEALTRRLEPLGELVDRYWRGYDPTGVVGTVVSNLRKDHSTFLAFVRAISEPGSEEKVAQDDVTAARSHRARALSTLEQGILTLDEMIRMQALADLTELSNDVAREAERLSNLEDADAAEILARLDRLERHLERLRQAAQELAAGDLETFVNSRVDDAGNLMDQIRKAVAEGRLDDARKLLDRLSQELKDLSRSLESMSRQRQSSSDDLGKELEDLAQELQALEKAERDLADQTAAMRQDLGADPTGLADRWNSLVERAGALAREYRSMGADLEDGSLGAGMEQRVARSAAEQAAALEGALKARDRSRSLERAQELEWLAERLEDVASDLGALTGEQSPEEQAMSSRFAKAHRDASTLRQALEDMEDRLSGASPEMQEAAARLADQQLALQERTQKAAERAGQVAPELPMRAPGLEEGVQGAAQEMGRAETFLREGTAGSAEGSQRLAADRLAEAQRALERARQDAMDMAMQAQGQGGQGQARRDGEPKGSGTEGSRMPDPVELPRASEFRTPEDYRRALLHGMEADVPREYEALKRRYYEELVRQ